MVKKRKIPLTLDEKANILRREQKRLDAEILRTRDKRSSRDEEEDAEIEDDEDAEDEENEVAEKKEGWPWD